jgi:hypothetical protein
MKAYPNIILILFCVSIAVTALLFDVSKNYMIYGAIGILLGSVYSLNIEIEKLRQRITELEKRNG